MMKKILAVFLLSLLATSYAQAKWFEVSSDHFLIYANQREGDIVEFANRLERYHAAMQWLFKRSDVVPSPSNRVTIYVLKSPSKVRKLYGSDSKYVAGFYIPRAGGSIAIISSIKKSSKGVSQSEQVLLHEYAHHYLLGSSNRAYPRWLSEGFAEFFSSAKFERDGGVGLGLPAYHRAYELGNSKKVAIEQLLDTSAYRKNKSKGYDAFYGRSWLLFHMLQFSELRQGQLDRYLRSVAEGTLEIEAAEYAFGDLDQLDKELDAYQKQKRMKYIPIPAEQLTIGSIAARQLTKGEAAAMSVRVRIKRGVDESQLADLLPVARKLLEKYPDSPAVLEVVAEAEYDANNDDVAIALSERIIALDASRVYAHTLKGLALARKAVASDGSDEDWTLVRRQFLAANKLENDHPVPLINYYQSYLQQSLRPPKNAVEGLAYALELSPFDPELRFMMAVQYANSQHYQLAIRTLTPLANHPHDTELAESARQMLARVQAIIDS